MRALPVALSLLFLSAAIRVWGSGVITDQPKITVVSPEDVGPLCSTTKPIAACTRIKSILTCTCVRSDEQWQRSVVVSLEPLVYTTSPAYLIHEFLHIGDVAAALRRHVDALQEGSYDSVEACNEAAEDARRSFGSRVDGVLQLTAARRDLPVHRERNGRGVPARSATISARVQPTDSPAAIN